MSSEQIPNERSNPLLWTIALVGFTVGVAWWFGYMFKVGVGHGVEHPLKVEASAASTGPSEPDHAAFIEGMRYGSDALLKLGKQAYGANCTLCHGADGGAPKIPGARNFLAESLENGADPYSLYLTLSDGYTGTKGVMPPQNQLSAEEKYAVVHYIREAFIKPSHPEAGKNAPEITDDYLANGSWPEPSAGGGGEAAGYHGDEFVVTAPILGAMAQREQMINQDDFLALDQLSAAAKQTDSVSIRKALNSIAADSANASYAHALIQASISANLDELAGLLTDPGRNTYQPSLALLSRPALADLARDLRAQAITDNGAGETK